MNCTKCGIKIMASVARQQEGGGNAMPGMLHLETSKRKRGKKRMKKPSTAGCYSGGCHLGPVGVCRFCGMELTELWGPSGYRLWFTPDGKRHSKHFCNILDPIWFCWRVWEMIEEKRK